MEKIAKVAILMPFHKEDMNQYELISFRNNVQILKKYPIYLVLPEGTNPKKFLKIAPNVRVIYFKRSYFETYQGSNLFWLHSEVYDAFKAYDFLLKCELDAFVFKDELEYWCNLGYDFIGAPWMLDWVNTFMKKQFSNFSNSRFLISKIAKIQLSKRLSQQDYHVGNGGLSLRKVSTFRVLSKILPYVFPNIFITCYQEDLVWNTYVAALIPFYHLPPYKLAAGFSIEAEPEICMSYNDGKLPFGCHAWHKYDISFWKPYIEARGFTLDNEISKN